MKCPKLYGEACKCDGYHTFDELYDHRIALYIALCRKVNAEDEQAKSLKAFKEGFAFDRNGWIRKVWRSKLHANGSGYGGWFILGIDEAEGEQISYHLPMSKWNETGFAETLDRAPEWDGHTSDNVLTRLSKL